MKRKIISIFLVGIILSSIATYSIASSLTEQQSELNEKIDEATEQQQAVQDEKESVLDEIQDIEDQILSYENEIADLENQIAELESNIEEKTAELEKLEAEYNKKDEELQEKLVYIQKYGQISYLDVLLGSDSFMDFLSNSYIVSELTDADNKLMEELSNTQKEVEKTKNELEEEKTNLDNSKKTVEAKNKQLSISREAKQEKVASLSDEEKSIQNDIDEYKAELKRIDEEIRRKAEEAKNDGIYVGDFTGTLSWPLSKNSANYNNITSYFGGREQPVPGASTNHRGIDIGVSIGTPVYAAADGYVLSVSYSSARGLYVLIKHGDNLYTRYQHLSSASVSAGQYVSRGQQIARSGNTGIGSGPHLHFEVLTQPYYGYEVNPLNYTHW